MPYGSGGLYNASISHLQSEYWILTFPHSISPHLGTTKAICPMEFMDNQMSSRASSISQNPL